jgi:hypothetical protein
MQHREFRLGAESGKHNRDDTARHGRVSPASRDTFANYDLQDEPGLAIPTGSHQRDEADSFEGTIPHQSDNIAKNGARPGRRVHHDSLFDGGDIVGYMESLSSRVWETYTCDSPIRLSCKPDRDQIPSTAEHLDELKPKGSS